MVLNLTDKEIQEMKRIVLDDDKQAALKFIKDFVKRLEAQKASGLKSHLENP